MQNTTFDAAAMLIAQLPDEASVDQAALVLGVFAQALADLGITSLMPNDIALAAAALRVRR